MKRSRFITAVIVAALTVSIAPGCGKKETTMLSAYDRQNKTMVVLTGEKTKIRNFYEAEFVVLGGGLGGIAAALAICSSGRSAYLIEETGSIAGCFSEPGVQAYPDNQLVDRAGTSKLYREFREGLRAWYEKSGQAQPDAPDDVRTVFANLGMENFCFSSEAALTVIDDLLKKNIENGRITVLKRCKVAKVTKYNDRVASILIIDLDGHAVDQVVGWGFIDATEHGDLFPLAGIRYVAGAEGKAETDEPHASAQTDSLSGVRMCACADSGFAGEKGSDCYVLPVRENAESSEPGVHVFPVMEESRRIVPLARITEQDISAESQTGPRARFFPDAVGVGYAPILLEAPDGSFTAVQTRPFQIPLGALMPENCTNVLAGNANLGATRVAAGAFRNPETRWAVGEAAGYALAFYAGYKAPLHELRTTPEHLKMLQDVLVKQFGVPIYWYDDVVPGDPAFVEAQLKPFTDPSYHEKAKTLHWKE